MNHPSPSSPQFQQTINDGLRVHRHTLVEMNRSVYTARRNAAHERLVAILSDEQSLCCRERRLGYYQICIDLIDGIVSDTTRSQVQPDSPLLIYLRILRRTIDSLQLIIHHDISLEQDTGKFAAFVGQDAVLRFQEALKGLASDEMNILRNLKALLTFGCLVVGKDYDERRASFTKEDFRRYDKAYQEYRQLYGSLAPEGQG